MNNAFIFDMDGVLVNSEQAWVTYENDFLDRLLGKKVSRQIGDTLGIGIHTIYDNAKKLGFSMDWNEFKKAYDAVAFTVYDRANMTPGIDELGSFLIKNSFKLGLVSSSPTSWIRKVLPRLSFGDHLESIISLSERSDLQPKPFPDGYKETMKNLDASPQTTTILEDSNSGIASAKASGAFTIGFAQNLIPGYQQHGADVYMGNVEEVREIIRDKFYK